MALLVSAQRWQYWLVPALLLLALAAVLASDSNEQLLLSLNAFGAHTGRYFWANITALGDAVVALALLLPLWRRRPDLLWAAALVTILVTVVVHTIKPLIGELRPPAVLGALVHVVGKVYRSNSFPSGHAATAFALAGVIVLGSGWRLVYWPLVALATLIALSRSTVGVHWPVDTLCGALIGWVSACAGLAIARRYPAPCTCQWTQGCFGLLLMACAIALVLGYNADYPYARWLLRGLGLTGLVFALLALQHSHEQRLLVARPAQP